MKPWIKLIILGIFCYAVFAALLVPVAKLYEWAGPVKGLETSGLQGNLVSGSAAQIKLKKYRVAALNWNFRPSGLLMARMAYDVTFVYEGQEMAGQVAASLFGTIYVSDFKGEISGPELKKLLNNKQLKSTVIGGEFQAIIDNLVFSDQTVTDIDAKIRWKDAKVSTDFGSPYMGTLQGAITANPDDGIMAVLSDPGKVLGLKANVQWSVDGKYTVKGTMKAKEELPQEIAALSVFIGGKQENGQTAFETTGQKPYPLVPPVVAAPAVAGQPPKGAPTTPPSGPKR